MEIIGEDEPSQLDPETIYFITNLLNEIDLITIRNKVLTSALPQRVYYLIIVKICQKNQL